MAIMFHHWKVELIEETFRAIFTSYSNCKKNQKPIALTVPGVNKKVIYCNQYIYL